MPVQGGVPDGGTTAAIGGIFFITLIIYVAILAVTIWSYGTLLKAALNLPKAMALLLLIPIVNFVMVIVWGVQAHNALKEREAAQAMQRPAA